MVSDCLSPASSLKPTKHHKLSEADNVDTPPARPVSAAPVQGGDEEEEVQSSYQQAAMTDGQTSPKRLRVTLMVSALM